MLLNVVLASVDDSTSPTPRETRDSPAWASSTRVGGESEGVEGATVAGRSQTHSNTQTEVNTCIYTYFVLNVRSSCSCFCEFSGLILTFKQSHVAMLLA